MRPAALLAGLLGLGLLAAVSDASAGPITTFNITGSGAVWTIAPDGTTLSQAALLTGTVSFTTVGSPDGTIDGGTTAAYGAHWVTSVYHLNWSGLNAGSFDSSPVAGANYLDDSTVVYNDDPSGGPLSDTPFDALVQQNASTYTDGPFQTRKGVQLTRTTTRTDWLSSIAYPETAGLAPSDGSPGNNLLGFLVDNFSQDPDTGAVTFGPGSYGGSFFLKSMTAVNDVPEPDTFILSGVGLAALGWRRRRRAAA
jgi:hypothetical protein